MNFLSEKAKRLTPYTAGIQPKESGWVKLNTNENPYPPSPKVVEALKNADIAKLRLYPDTLGGPLLGVLAKYFGLAKENVFCGNGSDEVLALSFQAFFSGKENVLMPDVSYGFYPVWGQMYDVGVKTVPLRDDFSVNPKNYKNAPGVVLANPGAPTGLALDCDAVETIARENPGGVVLIDEAYIDFADVQSALPLISKYQNLLIVRTFSKSHSLAGLRVGYALGNEALIDALRRVKDAFNSYPLDMLAQIGAEQAILDEDYFSKIRQKVISTREFTLRKLRQMGFKAQSSHTNFLFVECDDAKGLYEFLLKNKILVRYWEKPKIDRFLRVTVGTDDEMEEFLKCAELF